MKKWYSCEELLEAWILQQDGWYDEPQKDYYEQEQEEEDPHETPN